MKPLLTILTLFCFAKNTCAQIDKIWASYFSGIGYGSYVTQLELATVLYDNTGYIYFSGRISDTTVNLSTPGGFITNPALGQYSTSFIAKFDTLGNRIWVYLYWQ